MLLAVSARGVINFDPISNKVVNVSTASTECRQSFFSWTRPIDDDDCVAGRRALGLQRD